MTGRARHPRLSLAALLTGVAVFCLPLAAASAVTPPAGLDRYMRAAGRASGAYVLDVTANRVLYASRATTPRHLASNTKLFTTAAALERFGPGARLDTSVWMSGALAPRLDESGAVSGQPSYTLDGSLYLRGGGDPALGSAAFANRYLDGLLTNVVSLADEVAASGIKEVTGPLFADDTLFDRLRGVPYSGFRLTGYIGPLSALSYNEGYASDLQRHFAVDPALFAAGQLKQALRRRGIRVDGGVRLGRLPAAAQAGRQSLADVDSPTIADLVRQTNRVSNNFFAEMLLKGLGARFGAGGTTRAGVAVVRSVARQLGSRVTNYDGSGLTRSNSASPRAVVALLRAMLDRPSYAAFYGSLPIAGRQGTLRLRMRGTSAQDACRAKTGTIDYVSTLSGYCRTQGGHDVLFSFLMNGINVYAARRIQDRMAARIAGLRS